MVQSTSVQIRVINEKYLFYLFEDVADILRPKALMEGHVILSSLRLRQIKGFVQAFEETIYNSHLINVSINRKSSIT